MPKQLTMRNVPDEVAKRLANLSQERNTSINATVLAILEQAVGIKGRRQRIERYVTWTDEDSRPSTESSRHSESSMTSSGVEPVARLVLDTSAYSNMRHGHETVLDFVSTARIVLLPLIVLGELEGV